MASSAGIHLYFPRRGLLFSAPQARGCPLTSSGARSKGTQGTPARLLGKGSENLGAQVWGTTSTNEPVRPQPIAHRGLTEPHNPGIRCHSVRPSLFSELPRRVLLGSPLAAYASVNLIHAK